MSVRPLYACNVCGASTRNRDRRCKRHPRTKSERRQYSGTAAYDAAKLALLERDGPFCHYCGGEGDPNGPKHAEDTLELAHLVAHADGGPFVLENLGLAHVPCNRARGTR